MIPNLRQLAIVSAAIAFAGSAAAAPLGFKDARLGMTLGEWRSMGAPVGAGPGAAPTCVTASPGEARVAGVRLGAQTAPPDEVVCGYDTRYGSSVLSHSIRLDDRYRAYGLRYLFKSGKLAEIDYSASIDAYSDVMAALERAYGPPTRTQRDRLRTSAGRPRVRQIWRTAAGTVTLVDPSSDPVQLGVSITAAGAPPPGAARS